MLPIRATTPMANELVGRLNPATAQRIPCVALRAIIDTMPIVLQVAAESIDRRRCRSSWPHPLQAPDYPVPLTRKQPGHSGFNPFQGTLRLLPVLHCSQAVYMLRAMIVIQNLLGER